MKFKMRATKKIYLAAILSLFAAATLQAVPAIAVTTINCPGGGTYTISGGYVASSSNCSGDVTLDPSVVGVTPNATPTASSHIGFENNPGLTSITIPAGAAVSSISAGGAFYNDTALATVNILGGSPTSVGSLTFSHCASLRSINLPNSISFIGQQAFEYDISLTSISLPTSLTNISTEAFWYSGLTSFTMPNTVTTLGNAVLYSTPIQSLSLSTGLTTISSQDFQHDTALATVAIPSGVTSIQSSAFASDSALTSATFPNTLTSIGDSAFIADSSLTSIVIPSAVTTVGTGGASTGSTFQNCTSLASVTFSGTSQLLTISTSSFQGDPSLTSITIPDSVKSIYTNAFYQDTGLATATISNSSHLTYLGQAAFQYDSVLRSFNIPQSLTNGFTETNTLSNDALLSTVTFSGTPSLNAISNYMFASDPLLNNFTIPSSVTVIGDYAFQYDYSLQSITIPSSVTLLGTANYSVFYNDSALQSVIFQSPSQLTTIGTNTFKGNTSLTSIQIPSNVTTIGTNAFSADTALVSVSLPSTLLSIGVNAFINNTALTTVNWVGTPSLTTINNTAFAGDISLTVFTIPSSVTSLGAASATSTTAFTGVTFSRLTYCGNSATVLAQAAGTSPVLTLYRLGCPTAPIFLLSQSGESATVGVAIVGYTITVTVDTPTSYSISPSASYGLNFSSTTGLLSGTPTSAFAAHSYAITASNLAGSTTDTYTISMLAGSISGTASYGQVLTAVPSGFMPTSYQWQRAPLQAGAYSNIAGATGSTYIVVAGDVGDFIEVVMTGSNGIQVTSSASGQVTGLSQTITFGSLVSSKIDSVTVTLGTTPGDGLATASSGLTPTYTTTSPSYCSVTSTGTISLLAVGTCAIVASQAGNGGFLAATPVTQNLTIAADVPGAPTINSVSTSGGVGATSGSATVNFTDNIINGANISSYTITATPLVGSPITQLVAAGAGMESGTVTGLTLGTSYTISVYAHNSVGNSQSTSYGRSITPASAPYAVTALTSTQSASGTLTIHFMPPVSLNGGSSAVYQYFVTPHGTPFSDTPTYSTTPASGSTIPGDPGYSFTGLDNGTAYDVQIIVSTSANAGNLTASTALLNQVPAAAPNIPTITLTQIDSQTVVATWLAMGDNGSAITSFAPVVNLDGISQTCTFSFSASGGNCSITGVVGGQEVTASITATDAIGLTSNEGTALPLNVVGQASAPIYLVATAGDGSISVAFTQVTNGDSIIAYKYSFDGSTYFTSIATSSPILFSGLTNGTTYNIYLEAVGANYGTSLPSAMISAMPTSPAAPAQGTATTAIEVANQDSTILSYSPQVGSATEITIVTIRGIFPTAISNIQVAGAMLALGSWQQDSSTVTVPIPGQSPQRAFIQIFNGRAPLLQTLPFQFLEGSPTSSAESSTAVHSSSGEVPNTTTTTAVSGNTVTSKITLNIYFANASFSLKHDSRNALAELASQYSRKANLRVSIVGFVTPTRVNPNPKALAFHRDASVKSELTKDGLAAKYTLIYGGIAKDLSQTSRRAQIIISYTRQ